MDEDDTNEKENKIKELERQFNELMDFYEDEILGKIPDKERILH